MVGFTLFSVVAFSLKKEDWKTTYGGSRFILQSTIGLTMFVETQIPTHHNERTSGSSHSNLDPMKVIMQEFQLIRKDMKEMRGNIPNLSMEHRDQSNIGGHVTSHTE
ncbi:hypothetical protein M9H77_12942 [Catharanthus roseus]|uniref:Uncharacterized protein n=1 Tax=Catharanthus roseus TaxID=4058 RepID=A0ACC0BJ17_CATRO|nr:hypothetical protein M9H77_12942 [Catharanthus roseus]